MENDSTFWMVFISTAFWAGIVRNATPLVIASIGETITERAGVVNLSLDGSIVLTAMTGFVVGLITQNACADGGALTAVCGGSDFLPLTFAVIASMLVGGLVAFIIAAGDIELRQDQVAIGFVLTLLCRDIAQFLGAGYTRVPGPKIPNAPIPGLVDIPVVGPIFFDHDWTIYVSYLLVFGTWFWLFRTGPGMAHRAVGERPEAAFSRGTRVNWQRYFYTVLGGMLVGLAGAAYSLKLKPGWATPPNMLGDGWIALAIVIFGGWHPFRVVLGAYLFAFLRSLVSALQGVVFTVPGWILAIYNVPGLGWLRTIFGVSEAGTYEAPVTLLNALPWVLMIVTLVLVSSGAIERLLRVLPRPAQRQMRAFLRSDPPAALGTRFEAN
ncbi:MAG: ABC transporter permease [Chloroflexota bacterium]